MFNPLKVLCGVLCAAFLTPALANVATTAGSNLTAYNGTGTTNNNQWNNMMNGRAGMSANLAEANFGNCEAVILRCATPKCSSGCNDASVARPIVAGCVNSNATCKKHGDALIDSLTGQLVAKSTAKVQEQQNAVAIAQAQAQAQAAAASAAAEQSSAQMQQMQSQMAAMQQQMAESMANMQAQMAAQSESQSAQIQSALEENRNNAAIITSELGPDVEGLEGLGMAEKLAAKNGLSADVLVREQIGGQIQTSIDDAVLALKDLKDKLDKTLEYAGCDASANNCTGPKRVKKFKDLANEFFDPYENVVENMYDALMLAMTVGIDVSDVIMLLSGACNMWGKYMCNTCTQTESRSTTDCVCYDDKGKNCYYRVATDAKGKVSKDQPHCRLVGIISDGEDVQREWIDANSGMTGATQVACASDVVMNISLFKGMKKSATLDIDTLRGLVNQDTVGCRTSRNKMELDFGKDCGANLCMVNPTDSPKRMSKLQNAAKTKKLGKRSAYCTPDDKILDEFRENNETTVVDTKETAGTCAAYGTSFICANDSKCAWSESARMCVLKGQENSVVTSGCGVYRDSDTCVNNSCKWDNGKCVIKPIGGYTEKYIATGAAVRCNDYSNNMAACSDFEECHWVGNYPDGTCENW